MMHYDCNSKFTRLPLFHTSIIKSKIRLFLASNETFPWSFFLVCWQADTLNCIQYKMSFPIATAPMIIDDWWVISIRKMLSSRKLFSQMQKTSNKRPHENEYQDRWGNLPGLGSHPRYAAPRQPMEHRFHFISTHFHHNSFWELVAEVSNSSGLH